MSQKKQKRCCQQADATVTPDPEASESMELESEDISSDLKKPKKEKEDRT